MPIGKWNTWQTGVGFFGVISIKMPVFSLMTDGFFDFRNTVLLDFIKIGCKEKEFLLIHLL